MILGENDKAFVLHLVAENQKTLSHKYDPVKAHAYYERTKKLKGRRKKGATTSILGIVVVRER